MRPRALPGGLLVSSSVRGGRCLMKENLQGNEKHTDVDMGTVVLGPAS